jgi:hypothetical protein
MDGAPGYESPNVHVWPHRVCALTHKYLNNIVEQDHWEIKLLIRRGWGQAAKDRNAHGLPSQHADRPIVRTPPCKRNGAQGGTRPIEPGGPQGFSQVVKHRIGYKQRPCKEKARGQPRTNACISAAPNPSSEKARTKASCPSANTSHAPATASGMNHRLSRKPARTRMLDAPNWAMVWVTSAAPMGVASWSARQARQHHSQAGSKRPTQ